ncbi:hypothetical protein MMC13_007094 [Lambiella insularis]|nr:hypothetical protein [Lambiella insularis]
MPFMFQWLLDPDLKPAEDEEISIRMLNLPGGDLDWQDLQQPRSRFLKLPFPIREMILSKVLKVIHPVKVDAEMPKFIQTGPDGLALFKDLASLSRTCRTLNHEASRRIFLARNTFSFQLNDFEQKMSICRLPEALHEIQSMHLKETATLPWHPTNDNQPAMQYMDNLAESCTYFPKLKRLLITLPWDLSIPEAKGVVCKFVQAFVAKAKQQTMDDSGYDSSFSAADDDDNYNFSKERRSREERQRRHELYHGVEVLSVELDGIEHFAPRAVAREQAVKFAPGKYRYWLAYRETVHTIRNARNQSPYSVQALQADTKLADVVGEMVAMLGEVDRENTGLEIKPSGYLREVHGWMHSSRGYDSTGGGMMRRPWVPLLT